MSAVLAPYAPARPSGFAGLGGKATWAADAVILLLMSGALLAPLFSPDQNSDSVPWLRAMWLPVYGVIGLMAISRPAVIGRVWIGAAMSLVLVGWAFASTTWSIDPDVTNRRSIALLFTTLFGLNLAGTYDWKRLIELFAAVFMLLAVGTYISSIAFPGFGQQDAVHPGAWTGLWYEKNQLGWIMAHGCLACACAALLGRERRAVWIVGTLLCVGAVVMSRSVTSLLGVVISLGGLAGLMLLRRGNWVALTTVWAAVSAAGLFGGVLAFAPQLFFHLIGKDPSLTGRTEIWVEVLRLAADRPVLGYGFGAFWNDPWGPAWFIRHDLNWNVPHAHDGWLEMLLEIGAIGMGLAIAHFLIACAAAGLRLRRGPEAYWAVLFVAIFALFSVSESTVMQYNGVTWAIYIATMAKLFERRAVEAASRRVKLFPDE